MTYHMNTKVTAYQTEQDLAVTFDKWGVRDWEAQFNVMRSRQSNMNLTEQERTVTVRWIAPKTKREIRLSMGRHSTCADNIRVLYLAIEAMRMNEVRGIDETIQAAYFQLSAPANHWTLLGLAPTASREEVEARFREKAREAHPDAGGSNEAMAALNAAHDAALRELS